MQETAKTTVHTPGRTQANHGRTQANHGRTRWPVIVVTLLLGAFGPVCWAAEIHTPPSNTSGFLGGEASFLCSLTGHQPDVETFTWGKSHPPPYKTISSNNNSLDDVKYLITERYRLTVVKLRLDDEGTYACRMKNREYEASLTVLVRPSVVKLSWTGDRDWVQKGKKSRLTCYVTASRPRAAFRWFRATQDITSQAVSPRPTFTNATGFSSCESYLEVTPTGLNLGDVYTCTVDLPGFPAVKSVQLAVKFSSGQRPLPGYVGVMLLAIAASLRAVTA